MFGFIDKFKFMYRTEFLKKVIWYLLFGLLACIAVITGSRVVTGASCSSCPGKGICKGESDCSTFLSE
jgi:hypothetical protein